MGLIGFGPPDVMWMQISGFKLNMHEEKGFVGMWSGKRDEIAFTLGLESPLSKAGPVSSCDARKMFGVPMSSKRKDDVIFREIVLFFS